MMNYPRIGWVGDWEGVGSRGREFLFRKYLRGEGIGESTLPGEGRWRGGGAFLTGGGEGDGWLGFFTDREEGEWRGEGGACG